MGCNNCNLLIFYSRYCSIPQCYCGKSKLFESLGEIEKGISHQPCFNIGLKYRKIALCHLEQITSLNQTNV